MTAVGCGTVEVNPSQHSIKQREKCGLATVDVDAPSIIRHARRADVATGHDFGVWSRAGIDAFSMKRRRYYRA
jgi:DNA primase